MTVKELIAKLQTLPQGARVLCFEDDWYDLKAEDIEVSTYFDGKYGYSTEQYTPDAKPIQVVTLSR